MSYVYSLTSEADEEGQYEIGERITWTELIEEYVASRRFLKRGEKHCYDLKNSLAHAGAWFEAESIRPIKVSQHNATRHLQWYSQGRADITVRQRYIKLRALFSWAWRKEYFRTDKLQKMEGPAVTEKKEHTQIQKSELAAIVAQIALDWNPEHAPSSRFKSAEARAFFVARDVAATLMMAETGMRVGECFKAKLADYDPETGLVKLKKTKNGDTRQAPLTRQYQVGPLADWLAIRTKIDWGTDHLFLSETAGPLDPGAWGRRWICTASMRASSVASGGMICAILPLRNTTVLIGGCQ